MPHLWYGPIFEEWFAASRDQAGAGHYFTVDLDTRTPLHGWRPIDEVEG